MAYSSADQHSRDLDLFFRDKVKCVHVASGGGSIPDILAATELLNEAFAESVRNFEGPTLLDEEIEVNPRIAEIIGLPDNSTQMDRYLTSFLALARRGFHSYDKTNLGDFDDSTFHLERSGLSRMKPQVYSIRRLPADIHLAGSV